MIEIAKLQEAVRVIIDSSSSNEISLGVKMIDISLQKKLPLPRVNQNVEGVKFSQDEIDHLDEDVKAAYTRALDAQDVSADSELQVMKAKEKLEKIINDLKITAETLSAVEDLKAEILGF